jgi:phosphoribosylglycinamide formyltransferase-1
MKTRHLRIGVLGSGSGSNMQSIQDAIEAGTLDAEIVCVVTDVPGARILERAERHGIPGAWIDHAPYKTKLDAEAQERVIAHLDSYRVEWVVLAGYMRIVKGPFLRHFAGRVLNIHPALLPAFPGIAAWRQALDYGAKVAGVTVHFVDEGTDSGPIILQAAVPVEEDDTPETLHARIQVQEHRIYPEALRLVTQDRLRLEGRRVRILPPEATPTAPGA